MDGRWATKSEYVGLIVRALSFQDFQRMRSWSANVTEKQTTCNLNTVLCTKVHRAVKNTHWPLRVIGARGGLQFYRSKISWYAWCPLSLPFLPLSHPFCHALLIAARGVRLPPRHATGASVLQRGQKFLKVVTRATQRCLSVPPYTVFLQCYSVVLLYFCQIMMRLTLMYVSVVCSHAAECWEAVVCSLSWQPGNWS